MFSPAPWYRVPLPAFLAQRWFWAGLAGFALFFLARWLVTPDPYQLLRDGLAVAGLLIGLVSWLRGPSKGQVESLDDNVTAMREEMREGFHDLRQEMRSMRAEMNGLRGETRTGFAGLTALLVEIRDRLPPPPGPR